MTDQTPDPIDVEWTYWKHRSDGWSVGVVDDSGIVCIVPAASRDDLDAFATASRIATLLTRPDDATRLEVENPSEPVAHRVVLEQFDGGWPYWRLDCLHGATDERWHVYCGECTDSDCGHRTHHDVCIVRPWWDEEGVELVADTTGPLNVPFGVDVEWDGDVPRLIPRIAKD